MKTEEKQVIVNAKLEDISENTNIIISYLNESFKETNHIERDNQA